MLRCGGIAQAAADLGVSPAVIKRRLWIAGLVSDPMVGHHPRTAGSRRPVPWLEWRMLPKGGLRERIVERDARIRAVVADSSVDEVVAASGLDRAIVLGALG